MLVDFSCAGILCRHSGRDNGKTAKAGSIVNEGDIITVNYGTMPLSVLVTSLVESSKKEYAKTMYREVKKEG